MKKLSLLLLFFTTLSYHPLQATFADTMASWPTSLKNAAIFTGITTLPIVVLQTAFTHYLNTVIYDVDKGDRDSEFWKEGVGYGATLGLISSIVTLNLLHFAKTKFSLYVAYGMPALVAAAFVLINKESLKEEELNKKYSQYIAATIVYSTVVASFWIPHLILRSLK